MSRNKGAELRIDAFSIDNDLAAVTDEIYGAPGAALDTGSMRATPINIMEIWPDLTQPRRAVPPMVRGPWDGQPDRTAQVLTWWHEDACRVLGVDLPVAAMLDGAEITLPKEMDEGRVAIPSMVSEYIDLIGLASSIRIDGLANPISVVKRNNFYQIETGERRWLAYHLLANHAQGTWDRVPAFVKAASDVWVQAAENGARRPLNAIGMARQLALLIMDMYADRAFEPYQVRGDSDRWWYAQVAELSIKRGMADRVLSVTGLKSKAQISQYRRLLEISDELWIEADLEGYTEFAIRQMMAPKPSAFNYPSPHQPAKNGQKEADRLTAVNLQVEKEVYEPEPPVTPVRVEAPVNSSAAAHRAVQDALQARHERDAAIISGEPVVVDQIIRQYGLAQEFLRLLTQSATISGRASGAQGAIVDLIGLTADDVKKKVAVMGRKAFLSWLDDRTRKIELAITQLSDDYQNYLSDLYEMAGDE